MKINDIQLFYHYTVGRVLIAQFNRCVLVKSGQIANPIIAIDDPIPYVNVYVCKSINCETYKNSQFAINRYSQLKPNPQYINTELQTIGIFLTTLKEIRCQKRRRNGHSTSKHTMKKDE